MNLKHKKKNYIVVESSDIDKFIQKVYGQEFFCASSEEMRGFNCKSFTVCKQTLDDYEFQKLEKFKQKKDNSIWLQTLLNDLCNNNLIVEGEYLICIS